MIQRLKIVHYPELYLHMSFYNTFQKRMYIHDMAVAAFTTSRFLKCFHPKLISKRTKTKSNQNALLLLPLSPTCYTLTIVDRACRRVGSAVGQVFVHAWTFYFSSLPFALAQLSCHMSNNEPITGCWNFLQPFYQKSLIL